MNFHDLILAIEDMLKAHGATKDDIIYIQHPDGSCHKVDGFFRGEDGRIYIK